MLQGAAKTQNIKKKKKEGIVSPKSCAFHVPDTVLSDLHDTYLVLNDHLSIGTSPGRTWLPPCPLLTTADTHTSFMSVLLSFSG